jgi:rsbT co-antagonist protein RsbR
MSHENPDESAGARGADAGAGADNAAREALAAALEKLERAVRERKLVEEKLSREIAARIEAEERLQKETAERAEMEQELRSTLNIIRQQEEAIRAMATPILRLWASVLTMPVIGRLDSIRATQMMERLLHEITKTRSRFTILDLTGAEDLDASAANHLLNLIRAAGLLGTRCLVSGISPKMAQTIISLGLSLAELATFSTLEEALHHAIQESAARQRPGASAARSR